jgi:hypothetical protein
MHETAAQQRGAEARRTAAEVKKLDAEVQGMEAKVRRREEEASKKEEATHRLEEEVQLSFMEAEQLRASTREADALAKTRNEKEYRRLQERSEAIDVLENELRQRLAAVKEREDVQRKMAAPTDLRIGGANREADGRSMASTIKNSPSVRRANDGSLSSRSRSSLRQKDSKNLNEG